MSSNLQQIQIPNSPSLKDLLDLFHKDLLLNFNAHHIGTIQEFHANTIAGVGGAPSKWGQTAIATINYPQTFFNLNTATGNYDPLQVPFPILIDCPCIFMGGGDTADTYPVWEGDECLVLFNDRNLDNWFQGAENSPVATGRLHSFSDAVILIGIRSIPNILENFDTVRAVKRGGTAVLGVNPSNSKILLTNDDPIGTNGNYSYDTTLNDMISDLIDNIKTVADNVKTFADNVNDLVSATSGIQVFAGALVAPSGGGPVTGVSGTPVNASAITAIAQELAATKSSLDSTKTALDDTATKIAGLLE